ncbi:MAG: hypothetical protein GYA50_03480 [Eubacteriaceae bacterium]|nr:hypothetical protein [Eubacteriaceae bacterium]
MSKVILGIMLKQRTETSPKFQDIISDYGCYISTRIGLHNADDTNCSPNGIILLETINEGKAQELEDKIRSNIDGVLVQKMVF